MPSNTIGVFYIFMTALLWSFLGLLGKICLWYGLDPFHIAFLRAFFGFAAFFAHCTLAKTLKIPIRDMLTLMGFGVFGIGAYYAFMQYTILHAGASVDIVLQYTAPLWLTLYSVIVWKEKMPGGKLFFVALSALGTLLVCLSGGSIPEGASIAGVVTGILSGICYASHYPFTKIWQKRYPSATVFLYMLAGGCIALFLLNLANTAPIPANIPAAVWFVPAVMGVFCTYLAFLFFGLSIKHIDLIQAILTTELEPVLSILWVSCFFDESFTAIGWIGSILIVLSVFLINFFSRHAS